jgi:hypothetical protein
MPALKSLVDYTSRALQQVFGPMLYRLIPGEQSYLQPGLIPTQSHSMLRPGAESLQLSVAPATHRAAVALVRQTNSPQQRGGHFTSKPNW